MYKPKKKRPDGQYPLAECISKLTVTDECPEWFLKKLEKHGCLQNRVKFVNKTT